MNSLNYHIRRQLPALIAVALVLFLPSCNYIRQHLPFGKYSLKKAIEWAKQDSTRVADSLKRIMPDNIVIDRTLTDSMKRVMSEKKAFEKSLTDSLMSLEDSNIQDGDNSPAYYIIIGSFASHDNAKQMAMKYSRQGYGTTILSSITRNGYKFHFSHNLMPD